MRLTNEQDNLQEESIFQKEKPKSFKELNFKEKRAYIWDYYKMWIIGGVLFIIIAANAIPAIIENNKDVALYAVFINTQIKDQESTDIMDDYIKAKDIDMEDKRIVLDTSLIINRERADNFSMQSNQKLLALFSADEPDVVVMDNENFQFYAANNCFQSLEEVLPAELFEKYKPYMLECDSVDSDKPIYYGISVKTSKVLADEKAFIVDPIFTISANVNKSENAIKFLEYLMAEEIETDETTDTSGTAVNVSDNAVEVQ